MSDIFSRAARLAACWGRASARTSHSGGHRVVNWLRQLPSRLLILAVHGYRVTLGPWLGGHCRFVPSCSQYFIEAVEKYGAIRGAWKGFCRIEIGRASCRERV